MRRIKAKDRRIAPKRAIRRFMYLPNQSSILMPCAVSTVSRPFWRIGRSLRRPGFLRSCPGRSNRRSRRKARQNPPKPCRSSPNPSKSRKHRPKSRKSRRRKRHRLRRKTTEAAASSSAIRHPHRPIPAALPDTTARDRKHIRSSASLNGKVANTAAPTTARASMRWTNGDKGATHRVNARNTIFTPIRYGTARLAISSAETAETELAFSL